MKRRLLFSIIIFLCCFENFCVALDVEVVSPYDKNSVLKIIKKYLPKEPVIVEAGAFDGKDTLGLLKTWPQATIYSFEPDPYNFKKLVKNTKDRNQIHAFPLALSNKNETAIFYQSDDPNRKDNAQSGSLLEPKEHLSYSDVVFETFVKVKTIKLDDWAKQESVNNVDFLWLDTQGTELLILQAGLEVLKSVKAVYLEVEFIEAYANQYLYEDVKGWLELQGFTLVAKDFCDNDKKRWYGNIIMVRL